MKMNRTLVVLICWVVTFFGSGTASASCMSNGERVQRVYLSNGGKPIDIWETNPADIHRTTLGNGFSLGLKIEPATAGKYRELLAQTPQSPAFDELVKISVYDMSESEPKLLVSSWGGANSRQGYGPRGGAAMVEAIGEPGIELWLHKAVCLRAEDLTRLQ
jgi:hypothetical protein